MLEAENPLAYRRYCSRLPSSASAPRLPDAGQSRTRYERCWSAVGPPGSRTRSFCTCQGLRPRRVVQALANGAPVRVAFHIRNCVGTRDDRSFAVQWLACALPCRRFADALAGVCARLGASAGRYSFTVRDFHPLLLAGLPAHSETLHRNRHWNAIRTGLFIAAHTQKTLASLSRQPPVAAGLEIRGNVAGVHNDG